MDYPTTDVVPELFGGSAACARELPVGDVIEWFDFGQFVELYATDSSGTTHPLVITQDDVVLQASLRVREDTAEPVRTVDLAGGVPLTRAAVGEGAEAFKAIGRPHEITVDDVDDLIRAGEITIPSGTYRMTLRAEQAASLRDGERVLLRARLENAAGASRVWVELVPRVHDVQVTDLDQLLADLKVTVDGASVALVLETAEAVALLEARTVVVRGRCDGRTMLVKLRQGQGVEVGFSAGPAVTDFPIKDLAAFLIDPVVPGVGGLPYRVPLTKEAVRLLRAGAPAQLEVGGARLTLRIETPAPPPAEEPAVAYQVAGGKNVLTQRDSGRRERMAGLFSAAADKGLLLEKSLYAVKTAVTQPVASKTAATTKAELFDKGELPLPAKRPQSAAPPIPSLRVALFLPWRQIWALKGLSRGRLLHSLSLAPQEEATIELFTWERHRKTLDQSTESDIEQSAESTDTTKDTSDVYAELNKQQDFQWQVGGSLKATYRPVAGEVSVQANASAENKSTMGEIGKNTQNRVHEAVVKASTKVRSQRVTKISETVEYGKEERVTRKVKNPNMCHTLNLDYYEVLAHYAIETTFLADEARLCAFVPNPMSATALTSEVVRRNETALQDALLDGALRDGFEAIRTLAAYDEALKELKRRKAEAAAATQLGTPKPPPVEQAVKSSEEQAVLAALKDLRAAAVQFGGALDPHAALTAIGAHRPIPSPDRLSARRWLYRKLVEVRFGAFHAELMTLKDITAAVTVEHARQIVAMLPPASTSPSLGTLGELSDRDKETAALSEAIRGGHMKAEWDWGWWSGRCRDETLYNPDDMGIAHRVQRLAEAWQAMEAAPPPMTKVDEAAGKAAQETQQQSAEDVLEMKFPLESVARARERSSALLAHLADHWNFYRFALFQALPPSEQLERLLSASSGILRAGMFEPRVVSVHGDQLAVPLTTANYPGLEAFMADMTADVRASEPSDSVILLPTPGLSIESRLGRCTGCEEFIELSRAIELRRLAAVAEQAEHEAARRKARLEEGQLDDPTPPPGGIRVDLKGEQV